MEILTIKKINSQPFEGEYGLTNRVGIIAEEYGEKWLNGFIKDISKIKIGDKIFVEIKKNGEYLNFNFKGKQTLSQNQAPTQPEPRYVSNDLRHPLNPPTGQIGAKNGDVDWTAISRGKVRHGVALEAIKKDMPLDQETKLWIDEWTNFIMNGQL